ncbi:CBN-NHR-234 protein [Caenorhabditis brenneri]|uniref:CBN-NHR-234 protein n=1 Tax=Caenorhabditis brenneri TaxID=135651 RepID=G0M907_CAEBE|nr:CBN-NHR-234 protein [Caenorhabditis brenneri]
MSPNEPATTLVLTPVWLVLHFSEGPSHLAFGFCAKPTMKIKFICRSCRYNNCIKAGMKRDQVQQKKDEQKMPKYILESRKLGVQEIVRGYTTSRSSGSSPNSSSSESDCPTNSTRSNSPEILSDGAGTSYSDTTPDFSTILNAKHDELLQYYVKQIERATVMRQCEMPEDPFQQFIISKKINDQLALEICQTCPGTDLLERADLEILFRYCSFSSLWMDSAWITVASTSKSDIDGGDAAATKCGYENENEETEDEDTRMSKILIKFILHFHSNITSELSRLQLDVFEYAALKSFCIWKLALLDSTLTLKIVAQEQYFGVMSALGKYYQFDKNMEPSEIATRLGDITLILGSIFNVYQDMLKMYELIGIDHSIEDFSV